MRCTQVDQFRQVHGVSEYMVMGGLDRMERLGGVILKANAFARHLQSYKAWHVKALATKKEKEKEMNKKYSDRQTDR